MHSDGPEYGCWNLIYGTCSASDGQPTGSGQEMDTQVCVCVCVGFVLLDVSVCVGVLECLCFFPLFVCAGRGRLKSFRQQ